MTTWKARRVGDRILCGRPAADGGCRGEIATVVPSGRYIVLPHGMVEDPPGFWRLTARAQRQLADARRRHVPDEQQRSKGNVQHAITSPSIPPGGTRDAPILAPPALPFRRRCPVCNVLAEVTADLLE
jgi:hypothetical protein